MLLRLAMVFNTAQIQMKIPVLLRYEKAVRLKG